MAMPHQWNATCAALALALAGSCASAQSGDALRSAAANAIAKHPDVNARFNAYRAAIDAVAAARGSYWPRIDLNASAARDNERSEAATQASQSLNRTGVGLTITQLLWDGLGTRGDVSKLSHDQLARYFEWLDATEQVALEVARVHYDVMRLRRLVQLAEENYVQHRYAHLQIESRVKAGVGRGVDLEQAAARLAQAESTLALEVADLHDASARYLRVVGAPPPRPLSTLSLLSRGLPAKPAEALTRAIRHNAAVSAAIENLRASRALVDVRQAAYQPRVEARLRAEGGHNLDGVRDRTRSGTAELVLSWNLYSGGADQARVRQQVNLLNQAANQRDKACHDARLAAAIAFNDIARLSDQLVLLERNATAIEKARDAYRQQFDIGQRSLLDLLNAESERYSAARAYANAEHDLATAHARAHASMNQLGMQLGLSRAPDPGADPAEWAPGDDAPERCEATPITVESTSREDLDARAMRLSNATPGIKPPPRRP
jgi:outer membrane protein, adhesin transport system